MKNNVKNTEMFDDKLKTLLKGVSPAMQWALVYCAGSFQFGSTWGFIPEETPDYLDILKAIKDSPNREEDGVQLQRVSNGAVISCNPDKMKAIVTAVCPTVMQDNASMFNTVMTNEEESLKSLIYKYLQKKKQPIVINGCPVLGVHCVNNTNLSKHGQIEVPAFKLSLFNVLKVLNSIEALPTNHVRFAFLIEQDGKVQTVPCSKITTVEDLKKLYQCCAIATSNNCLLVKIIWEMY